LSLTVVGLTGGRTAGITDAGVQGLDGWHPQGAHVGAGLERPVGSRGPGSEARRPEEVRGRGAGGRGRGCSQAPEFRGGGSAAAATATASKAIGPHEL
jgi:hypothetical protein